MKTQGLIVLYQRLGPKAGVVHVHPHRFRHSFATLAIRSAAREIDVQHLLGHSTSAMVRRYTRTYDAEQAALAHASFSPVGHLTLAPRDTDAPVARPPVARPSRAPAAVRSLEAGMRFEAAYRGSPRAVEVVAAGDRMMFRLDDGREFTSLSGAGLAVVGGPSCNGWKFWKPTIATKVGQNSSSGG